MIEIREAYSTEKRNVKKRDNNCCQLEPRHKKNLQVHHIIEYRHTQDNSEENLITLCKECHKFIHQPLYLYNYKKVNYLSQNIYF